ncbi:MAG: M28 family peptidase [Promethearchaeota archaeon]
MREILTALTIILLVTVSVSSISPNQTSHVPSFNGATAYQYLLDQCDFGPRPPGSINLSLCRTMLSESFEAAGWNVTFQNFTYRDVECVNLVVTWHSSQTSSIILGAHYDTRPEATSDPDAANRSKPILGANDGASGVAVLLELSSSLPEEVRSSVEIVLFDAEDSGSINGWNWIQGSTYYVSQLTQTRRASVKAMVLVDMVGDENLRLPRESSSTKSLQNAIWSIAGQLGHNDTFLDTFGGSVTDDHSPFLDAGIPAVDLIQVPFPWYWHTLEDTPDKCSATSLEAVGQVLEVFVVEQVTNGLTFPVDDYTFIILGVVVVLAVTIILLIWRRRKDFTHF